MSNAQRVDEIQDDVFKLIEAFAKKYGLPVEYVGVTMLMIGRGGSERRSDFNKLVMQVDNIYEIFKGVYDG